MANAFPPPRSLDPGSTDLTTSYIPVSYSGFLFHDAIHQFTTRRSSDLQLHIEQDINLESAPENFKGFRSVAGRKHDHIFPSRVVTTKFLTTESSSTSRTVWDIGLLLIG